jgi:flagellar biosynthesis anti-sigma factor FlgM
MRVGLNIPDQQSISAEQAKKSSTSAATNPIASSPVDAESAFSQDTVTLSSLATQAMGTPEIRQTQVDSLSQSIRSGQYQLDPHQIADAILSR